MKHKTKHKPIRLLSKCTCLRFMIHTIVKLKWEHKSSSPINMGVSQILIMYIANLIIMAFNIIIKKHQNMLKMNNMKVVN